MEKTITLLTLFLLGYTFSQNTNDLNVNDLEKQVKDNIPGLENFNSSDLPSEEDLNKVLKEKCIKNGGGEEAYNTFKNQQSEVQACVQNQINTTELQLEIEESKKTGSMDEVFGKYCKKYPELYKCAENVIEKIKPCLDPKEQDTMNKTLNIVDELKEFICFKDGDRIAMFIAEGGVECLEERKEALQECANKTVGSRIPTDMSVDSLPMFLFTDRECNDFDKIRTCFNSELEKCKDNTPANIVDAFFKFLKKHLPCNGVKQEIAAQSTGSGSTSLKISFLVVAVALFSSKLM